MTTVDNTDDLNLTFDVEDLTFDELEELEELLDIPFDDFFSGRRRAKVMRGLAFIELRRRDPAYTWDQAGELKIKATRKLSAAADPTDASA